MTELVVAAMECPHGTLHLWPEVGVVEVIEGQHPVPPGVTGDLVCTSLINSDMPLIRYRVGDRGALPEKDNPCACGRTLPALARVEGRVDDVLFTADGRLIGRLDPVFKGDLPIREAQIIQESLREIRVRYVPPLDSILKAERTLIQELRARLGMVEVVLEPVQDVPRGPNGKFKAVINNIPLIKRH